MDGMGFNPNVKTPGTELKGLIPDFGVESFGIERILAMTWYGYDENLFQ